MAVCIAPPPLLCYTFELSVKVGVFRSLSWVTPNLGCIYKMCIITIRFPAFFILSAADVGVIG